MNCQHSEAGCNLDNLLTIILQRFFAVAIYLIGTPGFTVLKKRHMAMMKMLSGQDMSTMKTGRNLDDQEIIPSLCASSSRNESQDYCGLNRTNKKLNPFLAEHSISEYLEESRSHS